MATAKFAEETGCAHGSLCGTAAAAADAACGKYGRDAAACAAASAPPCTAVDSGTSIEASTDMITSPRDPEATYVEEEGAGSSSKSIGAALAPAVASAPELAMLASSARCAAHSGAAFFTATATIALAGVVWFVT